MGDGIMKTFFCYLLWGQLALIFAATCGFGIYFLRGSRIALVVIILGTCLALAFYCHTGKQDGAVVLPPATLQH